MANTNTAGFTSAAAITATVVAVAAAVIGIVVAAGLPLSKNLTDAVITFITVATPVVVAVIGWLHHSHAKVVAAREASGTAAARVNV